MKNHDGLLLRTVFPTLLGLALIGCVSAASAQDTGMSGGNHQRHVHALHEYGMMENKSDLENADWDTLDDYLRMDPLPMSYPFAAPGSINMYHWTDYKATDIGSGSAWDARYWREHARSAALYNDLNGLGPETNGTSMGSGMGSNNNGNMGTGRRRRNRNNGTTTTPPGQ